MSPRAFVFLGDNIYSDVGEYQALPEPERIEKAYKDLSRTPEFQAFLSQAKTNGTAIYGTWDDHDYGTNDGGSDYPYNLVSKGYFLDFFHLQKTATGDQSQPGVYQSHRLDVAGLDVQLILLDTRSFRSPLKKDPNDKTCPGTQTVADADPAATMLGDKQWQWLETQLEQSADLRIIASSIQVIPEEHCFEKWANFPLERQRLFDLINRTKAEGVILISGDRHMAEISKLVDSVAGYPIYEITSSGLNSAMGPKGALFHETNRYRIGKSEFNDNFGAITVHNENQRFILDLKIFDADGELSRKTTVLLEDLKPR